MAACSWRGFHQGTPTEDRTTSLDRIQIHGVFVRFLTIPVLDGREPWSHAKHVYRIGFLDPSTLKNPIETRWWKSLMFDLPFLHQEIVGFLRLVACPSCHDSSAFGFLTGSHVDERQHRGGSDSNLVRAFLSHLLWGVRLENLGGCLGSPILARERHPLWRLMVAVSSDSNKAAFRCKASCLSRTKRLKCSWDVRATPFINDH